MRIRGNTFRSFGPRKSLIVFALTTFGLLGTLDGDTPIRQYAAMDRSFLSSTLSEVWRWWRMKQRLHLG